LSILDVFNFFKFEKYDCGVNVDINNAYNYLAKQFLDIKSSFKHLISAPKL